MIRVLISTGLLVLVTSCTPVPVPAGHAEQSVMVNPVTPELARAAIVTVLNRRRHSIVADEPGRIAAALGRGPVLNVEILYDPAGFRIRYLDSQGFELGADATTGEILYDSRYVGWMRRLRTLVDREIATLHGQALEQEQRERDREYDVAVAQQRTEEAALAREQQARLPPPQITSPAQPQGAQPGSAPLQAGFNITRAPNNLGSATVVVMNESAEHLHAISFRQAGATSWRPNQLQRTVPPGSSFTVHGASPGLWELRVEDRSSYKEWHDLRLQGGGEYTLVVTSQGWFRQ